MTSPYLLQSQVVDIDLESVSFGYVDNDTTGSRGLLYDETGGSGSGSFKSFMTLQAAQDGIEQGINHSSGKAVWNESTGAQTMDFRGADFAAGKWFDPVTGKEYYQFSIDVNQVASSPRLSLDNIRIFSSSTPLSSFDTAFVSDPNNPSTKPSASSVFIWALDSGSYNNTVKLPYQNGSGKYEASVYLPATMFTAAIAANDYIYFYTQLGGLSGFNGNDGPEEWAVNISPGLVPEPYEYGLVGVLGLLGLAFYEGRKAQQAYKTA